MNKPIHRDLLTPDTRVLQHAPVLVDEAIGDRSGVDMLLELPCFHERQDTGHEETRPLFSDRVLRGTHDLTQLTRYDLLSLMFRRRPALPRSHVWKSVIQLVRVAPGRMTTGELEVVDRCFVFAL